MLFVPWEVAGGGNQDEFVCAMRNREGEEKDRDKAPGRLRFDYLR